MLLRRNALCDDVLKSSMMSSWWAGSVSFIENSSPYIRFILCHISSPATLSYSWTRLVLREVVVVVTGQAIVYRHRHGPGLG